MGLLNQNIPPHQQFEGGRGNLDRKIGSGNVTFSDSNSSAQALDNKKSVKQRCQRKANE